MNQDEWKEQSERLMESQEVFVTAVGTMAEIVERLSARLSATDVYLDRSCDAHAARESSMGAQEALLNLVLESLIKIQTTFLASNATINENSERLDRLLAKVESYIAGRDHEN
jgi:hypothetical protein